MNDSRWFPNLRAAHRLFAVLSLFLIGPSAVPASAQNNAYEALAARVADLAAQVDQHKAALEEQRRLIDRQAALLRDMEGQLARANGGASASGTQAVEAARESAPLAASLEGPSAGLAAAPAAAVSAPPAPQARLEAPADPNSMRASWNNGLQFDSADGNFQVRIGGRIHNDWAFFSSADAIENVVGPIQDGTEFRRTRLHVDGQIHRNVNFRAEYDFAGGLAVRDVSVGVSELPGVGNVRVGHFKEPFSLEEITSDNYITFLERSLPNTFAPSRNIGIMAFRALPQQRMTLQLGLFRDTNGVGEGFGDGKYNLTGRVTGRPWYADGGRKLFHAGLAYSRRKSVEGQFRFSGRPEAHLAPSFVDTGSFAGSTLHLIGTEAMLVLGPASVQSEYMHAFADRPGAGRADFSSFYVFGSYFLTGEHRTYSNEDGLPGRIRPNRNFGGLGDGWGAWEVVARFSRLDLDDQPIFGGVLQDATLGLNWYLNPNTRIMWNYVAADRVDIGRANSFQTRFQVDF